MTKITYVCEHCQSTDIVWDANLRWDVEKQAYYCTDTRPDGPYAYCSDCNDETHYVEQEVADAKV